MSTEENIYRMQVPEIGSFQDIAQNLQTGESVGVELSKQNGQKTNAKITINTLEREDGSGNIWVVGGTVTNSATTTPINCVMLVNFRDPSKNWLKVT